MIMNNLGIFQLTYLIPSLLFMGIVGFLLIRNIFNGTPKFCNEFYPFICYRIINDLIYHISMLLLLKLPMWGYFKSIYSENDFLAQMGFFFGTSTCCIPFIHALVISFIRFIAIYYPMKYKVIFISIRIKQICIGMFLCSFCIGVPTIFFKSKYDFKIDTITLTPTYLTTSIIFYQIFYGIFFYGTIIVIAFGLNVLNIIGLNRKKYNKNIKYSEKYYIIYSFFTLITSILMEIYFVLRIGGTYFGNVKMTHNANAFLSWTGDLVTLGGFYFFIFVSKDVRKLLKETFGKIFNKINYSYNSEIFFQIRSNDVIV